MTCKPDCCSSVSTFRAVIKRQVTVSSFSAGCTGAGGDTTKHRRDTLLHPFPLIVIKDKCEVGCHCSPNPRAVRRSWEFPSTGEGQGLLVRSCVGQSSIGTGEPTSLALRTGKASPGLKRWLHTMLKCWSHKHQDLSSIPHEEAEHTLAVPALWR